MMDNTPRVSTRLRRNAALIVQLSKAQKGIRDAALQTASRDLVLALVECAKNVILGAVSLSPSQLRGLPQHRRDIEDLVKSSTTLQKRRRILQKGGFLGLLVKLILGILGGLLGGGLLGGGGGRRR